MRNPTSFDLIIPEEVEAKIRHLCSKVHDVEWSGTLFYRVEGSLDDGTFKATCIDICVMDIGTGGYTEFKDTEDIISYRLEHDLLHAGIYEALIHSHNNMNAFFSGTDVNTLIDEGTDLNHFLSLIVCNAGQYVARITRKLKTVTKAEANIVYTKTVKYDTFEGETKILSDNERTEATKTEEKQEEVVEYFELRINKTEVPEPFKELDQRLEDIKKKKARPIRSYGYPTYQPNFGYSSEWRDNLQRLDSQQLPAIKTEEVPATQLKMFTEDGEEIAQAQTVRTEEEEVIEFYDSEKVPYQITRTLCVQLLCGTILASSRTNVNLHDWVKKMDRIYEERFGFLEDEYNYLRLQSWVEMLIEEMLTYSVDEKYEKEVIEKYKLGDDFEYEDTDAFMHLYSCAMYEFLDDLPDSKVKELMMESLEKYMPYGKDNDNTTK